MHNQSAVSVHLERSSEKNKHMSKNSLSKEHNHTFIQKPKSTQPRCATPEFKPFFLFVVFEPEPAIYFGLTAVKAK